VGVAGFFLRLVPTALCVAQEFRVGEVFGFVVSVESGKLNVRIGEETGREVASGYFEGAIQVENIPDFVANIPGYFGEEVRSKRSIFEGVAALEDLAGEAVGAAFIRI
jgi:hypothetical protein